LKLLLDTHLLLWAAAESRLSKDAKARIDDPNAEILFSPVSIWEIAIKSKLGKPNFNIDAAVFRRELFEVGYIELPINGVHAAAVGRLPDLHKDPFDRLLIAQATVEGITLLSADEAVLSYPGPIERLS
jgi:PIN domain nuclease of toxin-antitoxin system